MPLSDGEKRRLTIAIILMLGLGVVLVGEGVAVSQALVTACGGLFILLGLFQILVLRIRKKFAQTDPD
jgi:hypothetical protein